MIKVFPAAFVAGAVMVSFLILPLGSIDAAAASSNLDGAPTKAGKQHKSDRGLPASKPRNEAQIKQRNQLKRLESHGRSINRLQRSQDPNQRQQARDQHRELMKSFKRAVKQYDIPTRIIEQPKISALFRRGGYDKFFPDDECIPFIESATVACYLTQDTKTKCVYECYEKEGEPVGVR